MKKVSVIMAAYNAESTVQASVESVLKQSYKNIEIIIVNDGSKDKTLNILKDLSDKYENVIILDQENSGPGRARNAAIDMATGEYMMFIDSDDFYSNNMVEKMVYEIESSKYDLCACGIKNEYVNHGEITDHKDWVKKSIIYNNKKELFNDIDNFISSGLLNSMCNKIYKSNIIKTKGLRVLEGSDMGEDLCFNILYIDECESVSIIEEPLYIYRIDITKGLTSAFREDEFNKRKINLKMLNDLYEKNNVNKNRIYFEYVIMAYSCFTHLFKEANTNTFKENIQFIKDVINSKELSNALENIRYDNITQFISTIILKSKMYMIIYFVSFILNKIIKR